MNPGHQEIEMRAYQLWEERGYPWGTPENDWFKAEHELATKPSVVSTLAREVGAAIGIVVGLVTDAPNRCRPNRYDYDPEDHG